MQAVRRFQVVAGKHHDGSTDYKAGDVLESTRRLDQIYRNKFVEVSDVTPITAPPDPHGLPPPEHRSVTVSSDAGLLNKNTALQKANNLLQEMVQKQDAEIQALHSTIETLEAKLATADGEKPPVAPTVPTTKRAPKGGKGGTAPATAGDTTEEDPFNA